MRCCGCAAAAAVVLVLVVVGVAAFTGFVPGLSSLAGTDKPRDLQVRYTQADYNNFYTKAQVQVEKPEYLCLDCRVEYSGRQPVDAKFTQSEITALLAISNQKFGPIRDPQIRFNNDQTLELATMLVREQRIPLYFKGKPLKVVGGKLNFDLMSVEAGRLPLPGSVISQSPEGLQEAIDAIMKGIGVIDLNELRVEAGGLYFRGVLPKIVRGLGPPESTGGSSRP